MHSSGAATISAIPLSLMTLSIAI